MHDWVSLADQGFPDYAVSDGGDIKNVNTNRVLIPTFNQSGVAKVNLVAPNGRPHTLSLAKLVATAFIPQPDAIENHLVDHVINLSGDRSDCSVDNLAWRPFWFAKQYHRQYEVNEQPGILVPIQDRDTLLVYENSWDVCKVFGLLDRYVVMSVTNGTSVYPTGQVFDLFE